MQTLGCFIRGRKGLAVRLTGVSDHKAPTGSPRMERRDNAFRFGRRGASLDTWQIQVAVVFPIVACLASECRCRVRILCNSLGANCRTLYDFAVVLVKHLFDMWCPCVCVLHKFETCLQYTHLHLALHSFHLAKLQCAVSFGGVPLEV